MASCTETNFLPSKIQNTQLRVPIVCGSTRLRPCEGSCNRTSSVRQLQRTCQHPLLRSTCLSDISCWTPCSETRIGITKTGVFCSQPRVRGGLSSPRRTITPRASAESYRTTLGAGSTQALTESIDTLQKRALLFLPRPMPRCLSAQLKPSVPQHAARLRQVNTGSESFGNAEIACGPRSRLCRSERWKPAHERSATAS